MNDMSSKVESCILSNIKDPSLYEKDLQISEEFLEFSVAGNHYKINSNYPYQILMRKIKDSLRGECRS